MRMLDSRMEERGTERSRKIGSAMRDDRKNAGYTIRELATKMDISPTHLTRIELGERIMDSVEKLILFCDVCHVPIEKYLVLCGMRLPEKDTPIRRAFPAIKTNDQEKVISAFANSVTSHDLTNEELEQMVTTAVAFAEFCSKKNQQN